MHEFSLAVNIYEIVEETVRKNNVLKVSEVVLDVGNLSGVELQSLETALLCLKPGSIIENGVFRINPITGEGICSDCQKKFVMKNLLEPCPQCGSYRISIISGKELVVKSITAE
jgi:hydrogenase nickel incorporation protein HypA/HybF